MASPTNLTDRISHLRERGEHSPIIRGGGPQPVVTASRLERRPATDNLMIFAYALLGLALLTQVGLILLLEVL
ncbi:MAG: hypothetical protein ACLFU4_07190 [Opitutales bacterium]